MGQLTEVKKGALARALGHSLGNAKVVGIPKALKAEAASVSASAKGSFRAAQAGAPRPMAQRIGAMQGRQAENAALGVSKADRGFMAALRVGREGAKATREGLKQVEGYAREGGIKITRREKAGAYLGMNARPLAYGAAAGATAGAGGATVIHNRKGSVKKSSGVGRHMTREPNKTPGTVTTTLRPRSAAGKFAGPASELQVFHPARKGAVTKADDERKGMLRRVDLSPMSREMGARRGARMPS